MFNKYTICSKIGLRFLLEIHNHSRHTFSQYSKEGKKCQNGSSFVIPFNPVQARSRFKGPGGGLRDPPMISKTIQASEINE